MTAVAPPSAAARPRRPPSSQGPPKAPLALRVGVVGHRPDRLPLDREPATAETITAILEAVAGAVVRFQREHRGMYAEGAPTLRAITSLAEGADQIFAECALALGYHLSCPFPFEQTDFENDFVPPKALKPGALDVFRGLLERARSEHKLTIFQLDGRRDDASAAYGAAGRLVLSQSDILVVVWDGKRLGKSGGTEEVLDEAIRRGVPTVWIDAHAPARWQVLVGPSAPDAKSAREQPAPASATDDLTRIVDVALALPLPLDADPGAPDAGVRALDEYYGERWPGRGPAPPAPTDSQPGDLGGREFYVWADELAVSYSKKYRRAFLVTYALAAAAVGMALMPTAAGWLGADYRWQEMAAVSVELVMILAILILVYGGHARRWHERWIDYRLEAELLRELRFLVPLGVGVPSLQAAAHHGAYGLPGATRGAWYARAVEREIGLPKAKVDRVYLQDYLNRVIEVLDEQLEYHTLTAQRSHRTEDGLHLAGMRLLALTLLACILHLLTSGPEDAAAPDSFFRLLVFLCGFLPACGASLAGINNQGEFLRIAKRSKAMVVPLKQLRADAMRLRELSMSSNSAGEPSSIQVAAVALKAAQLMVSAVLDWRVVFLDRPLNPPS